MGVEGTTAHDPVSKEFFGSFLQKRTAPFSSGR
jgi:hypothetical protein